MLEKFNENPKLMVLLIFFMSVLHLANIIIMVGCPRMIIWFVGIAVVSRIIVEILERVSDFCYYHKEEITALFAATLWPALNIILFIYFYSIGKYIFWRN